mmetsp:Transcript_98570/g.256879  ORF Transcript_98570/g.256879 Transcript_98570/m.256879 type:complete len:480 (+) Transcript_98570:182-1621(+)
MLLMVSTMASVTRSSSTSAATSSAGAPPTWPAAALPPPSKSLPDSSSLSSPSAPSARAIQSWPERERSEAPRSAAGSAEGRAALSGVWTQVWHLLEAAPEASSSLPQHAQTPDAWLSCRASSSTSKALSMAAARCSLRASLCWARRMCSSRCALSRSSRASARRCSSSHARRFSLSISSCTRLSSSLSCSRCSSSRLFSAWYCSYIWARIRSSSSCSRRSCSSRSRASCSLRRHSWSSFARAAIAARCSSCNCSARSNAGCCSSCTMRCCCRSKRGNSASSLSRSARSCATSSPLLGAFPRPSAPVPRSRVGACCAGGWAGACRCTRAAWSCFQCCFERMAWSNEASQRCIFGRTGGTISSATSSTPTSGLLLVSMAAMTRAGGLGAVGLTRPAGTGSTTGPSVLPLDGACDAASVSLPYHSMRRVNSSIWVATTCRGSCKHRSCSCSWLSAKRETSRSTRAGLLAPRLRRRARRRSAA